MENKKNRQRTWFYIIAALILVAFLINNSSIGNIITGDVDTPDDPNVNDDNTLPNDPGTNIQPQIGTNFIPIETWEVPAPPVYSPSYIDYSVTHNGNPSIRQEGLISDGKYYTREVNRGWTSPNGKALTIQAGDIITLSAWIKCAPSTVGVTPYNYASNVHCGGWLGCDFWATSTTTTNTDIKGWIDGLAYGCKGEVPLDVDHVSAKQVQDWCVPMGSDWTYRSMSFTVPTGAWGTSERAYTQIIGMGIWFGCYVTDANGNKLQEMGNIWISEPTLTIQRNGSTLSIVGGSTLLDDLTAWWWESLNQ